VEDYAASFLILALFLAAVGLLALMDVEEEED
jgi:hypothetical protein